MNLPNLITSLRCALAFVVVFAYIEGSELGKIIAIASFCIAAISDWLDGFLARKYNLITNFGKLMDPLADKILIAGALIALCAESLIPVWATFLILFREFAVSGLRQIASDQGITLAADNWGKIKTVLQLVIIFFIMCVGNMEQFTTLSSSLIYLMTIVTIYSGLRYFWGNRQLFSKI